MKRAVRILLCVLLLKGSPFALESNILKSASKYLPNLTETGYLINVVNLYVQMSQFVRSTNRMVENISQAKRQWQQTADLMEDLYTDLEALKNIDPYDMDSWSATLQRANNIIRYDIRDVRHSFAMLEFYTLDNTEEYIRSLGKAAQYDYRNRQNRQTVQKYFETPAYETALSEFVALNNHYAEGTLTILRAQLADETDSRRRADLLERIHLLEEQVRNPDLAKGKLDSVLELSSDLITVNLTEIQVTNDRIGKMEEMAGKLREGFERLKSGSVNTRKKSTVPAANTFVFDISQYDAQNPDNVAAPSAPQSAAPPKPTRKKTVAEQDVIALQNGIAFLALKQESLSRDIAILKANTMNYITALEALKQQQRERDVFTTAHGAKVMQLEMEAVR